MPGCETTIFASVTGEVGAPANSQFRVNSFLPTLYWYVDQDVIGIGIENDIDSGIGPSLAARRSLWGIQPCPPRQSDRMSGFAPWTCIICHQHCQCQTEVLKQRCLAPELQKPCLAPVLSPESIASRPLALPLVAESSALEQVPSRPTLANR